jgi:hypothetical protein
MYQTAPSMDLIALAQGFMTAKQEELALELAEKYGVPLNEVTGVVDSFLRDTYGPALNLAKAIHRKESPALLFIGRKDCTICQRSRPVLESFLLGHEELQPVVLDYSQPEGLIYHIIHRGDTGMLPLIALIFRGAIKVISSGECVGAQVYEKYYNDIQAECSQNIYVH